MTTVSEPRIPDFVSFCLDQNLELPWQAQMENTARTACKIGLYPELYWSGRYNDAYKLPIAADANYYISISKKGKK